MSSVFTVRPFLLLGRCFSCGIFFNASLQWNQATCILLVFVQLRRAGKGIKKKNKTRKKTEKLWYFEKASARHGGASEPALFLMWVRGLSGPLFESVLCLFGLAAELLARRNAAGDEGFGEGPFEGWG